jgi:hypothetical protein
MNTQQRGGTRVLTISRRRGEPQVPPETTWTARDKYTVTLTAKQPWVDVVDFFQVVNIIDKDTAEGPNFHRERPATGLQTPER